MHYERISTPVRLVMTFVGCLLILSLSLFGSGWPTPSETVHGQTIPTVTSEDGGGGGGGQSSTPTPVVAVPSVLTQTPSPVPVPKPGEISVKPGESSSGESANRRCGIVVTSGDISEPGTILLTEVPVDSLPKRDKRYTYLRACDVQFRDLAGTIIATGSDTELPRSHSKALKTRVTRFNTSAPRYSTPYVFANPLSVCFPYTDADLVRAQNKVALLTTLAYNAAKEQWFVLPVVLDEVARQICGQMPQTGIVALAVKSAQAAALPNTSGNLPEVTPAVGGASAAPAPTVVPDPAAGNPVSAQSVAPAAPTLEFASAAGNAAPARSVAAPAPETASDVSTSMLVIGLLVAALVAVAILVLSRGFLARSTEE